MPTDLLGRDYETFPAPEPLQTHGPARIIAMCNQKGGVGKTTSSINIAGALSQYGRRVLIVDFDPQGAATVGLASTPIPWKIRCTPHCSILAWMCMM